jgi:hypothetical protein
MAAWGADKTGYGAKWPNLERSPLQPPEDLQTKWPNLERSPLEPPEDLQRGYARTYATAIAGEALSMHFNVSQGPSVSSTLVPMADCMLIASLIR